MLAAIVEYFPGVDLATVSEVIMDYQPVIQVLQHTWSHETFGNNPRKGLCTR